MIKALLPLMVLALMISCSTPGAQKIESAEQLVQVDGSVPNVQKWIMEGLGDNIGTYESLEWSGVEELQEANRKYVVRHQFKAQMPNTSKVETYNWLFYMGEYGEIVDKAEYK